MEGSTMELGKFEKSANWKSPAKGSKLVMIQWS